jgi:hypothetical protein
MGSLRFVPYGSLFEDVPSVVVDGSPAPGTVLCLSHWPGIGSPAEFQADLSAEMAFLYLSAFDRHGAAAVVSNNHFDQDGLVGVWALAHGAEAPERRALLTEVARAGDFAVTSCRDAARVSMVLSAYADPERSPLPGLGVGELADYDVMTAVLYEELLGLLGELCDDVDRWRPLWEEEDAMLTASEAALESGAVTIEEVPDIDLAVVTVPESGPHGGGHRFAGQWASASGLHPMAVNNATDRGALLTVRDRKYELTYRYESWVQFRTRLVRPRVDLAPLVESLTAAEAKAGGSASWSADHVSALTPVLSLSGRDGIESALDAAVVRAAVESHLRTAPPAWDPYAVTQ